MFRRFALLLLLLAYCIGCRSGDQHAIVQRVWTSNAVNVSDVRFPSSSVRGFLFYRAIIPAVTPGEHLPVLYMLHGANSDPSELMRRSDILNFAIREHLIVVLPNGRLSYYTNAKHQSNSRWEDAIREELPSDVENRFPVLKGRQHTGIAGISMGGYGAVKFALKHPEQYGFVGNLSGALDITRRGSSMRRWGQTWRIWMIFGADRESRQDEDVFNLLDHSSTAQGATWFESCGRNDPLRAVNERFARKMRERGADINYTVTPGGHDWQSWRSAMPQLFTAAHLTLQ